MFFSLLFFVKEENKYDGQITLLIPFGAAAREIDISVTLPKPQKMFLYVHSQGHQGLSFLSRPGTNLIVHEILQDTSMCETKCFCL